MILDQIASYVREGLPGRKKQAPQAELEQLMRRRAAPRDFSKAVKGHGISFIAEIKRASPSKGWLCRDLDVVSLANSYTRGGACAISVLTETRWFKGDLIDLTAAHEATVLPLLCKDFILDPYQIYEARAFGADAVLLITSLLSLSELSSFIKLAHELGMEALVEVHNEIEVKQAVEAKANIIGINNRNLADFTVDLNNTFKLRPFIPSSITVVSESGIKTHGDVKKLISVGVSAVLVGETLVSSSDPEAKLRELIG